MGGGTGPALWLDVRLWVHIITMCGAGLTAKGAQGNCTGTARGPVQCGLGDGHDVGGRV